MTQPMTPAERDRLSRLEDLFFNAPVSLHVVGPDGVIQHANRSELELLGYDRDPSAYVGHSITEFHADRTVIDDMLERLLGDRPLANHSARLIDAAGDVRPVVIDSNSRMEDGRFVNTRCFTRPAGSESLPHRPGPGPVSSFATTAGEPRDRLLQLEDFFDNARVGVIVLDADGRVERANAAALGLAGRAEPASSVLGQPLERVMGGGAAAPRWLAELRSGAAFHGQAVGWPAADGDEISLRLYANARDDHGGHRLFVYADEDATGGRPGGFTWPSFAG